MARSQRAVHSTRREVMASLADKTPQFLSFLRQRMTDPLRAEDLLQSAFARALEHAAELRRAQSAEAWFYRILRNALTDDYRRRVVRDREIPLENPDQLPARESKPLRACPCAGRELRALKPEYADALRTIAMGGTAVRAYAREHGISPAHASVRLHRARTALRQKVEAVCQSCAQTGCVDCSCA